MSRGAVLLVVLVIFFASDSSAWLFGGGGGRKSSSSSSSSDSNSRTVGKSGWRERDETGHRSGLGTLAREFVKNPVKTVKAVDAFRKSYNKMTKENVIGNNLKHHEQANYDATKAANKKVAEAISAGREQYKSFRVKKHPRDGTTHYGDTRSDKEVKDTMNANKQGRERATNEKNGGNK